MKKRSATYVVPGDPIPKARIRFRNRRAYDKQREDKKQIAILLLAQHTGPLFTGPIYMNITFFMPIPESYSLKRQRAMPGCYHIKKPDLSNMIKFYEDVCNRVVLLDDSIICRMDARKLYVPWNETRTEIYIESVDVYDEKEKFNKEATKKQPKRKKK